jgi:hypothetical protein
MFSFVNDIDPAILILLPRAAGYFI